MFNNIYKNQKVLITGHTGFKGTWLTQWLLKLGAEVIGYSKDVPSDPSHFEELDIENNISHYIGDVRDLELLKSVFDKHQPSIVFHLAAQSLVRASYDDPHETFSTNTIGTLNVLEIIRTSATYVKACVLVTSDKCYDNVEWMYGYRENDRLGGDDPYSGSKGCAELVAKSYMRSFFKEGFPHIATARAGNVIGGGDWAKDRIIPDIVRAWSKDEKVDIRSPHATRPWQHVLEPLSGYLALGAELCKENSKMKNESFNFGPDSKINKTVGELIDEMEISWDNAPGWIDSSNKVQTKTESTLLKLNCDKSNIMLNWYPVLGFKETLEMTSTWYYDFYFNEVGSKNLTIQQLENYCNQAKEKEIYWAKRDFEEEKSELVITEFPN